jgi:hypothetical protein
MGAAWAFGLSLVFFGLALLGWTNLRATMANAYVFPAAGLLWLLLACYLVMLGLIAEVAVWRQRQNVLPIAVERSL